MFKYDIFIMLTSPINLDTQSLLWYIVKIAVDIIIKQIFGFFF